VGGTADAVHGVDESVFGVWVEDIDVVCVSG